MTTVAKAVLEISTDASGVDAGTEKLKANFTRIVTDAKAMASGLATPFSGLSVRLENVNRLTEGFLGTRTIQAAEEYAAAVTRIGGPLKLTESEQAKVNAVVSEAIRKYQQLGQTAPKELTDLAVATTKVVEPTQNLDDQLKALDQTEKGLAVSIEKVNSLYSGFSGKDAIKGAEEYAAAVQKVGGASKLTKAEQDEVNKAVTQAIVKYESLGQTAPAHLLKLQAETKQVETQTSAMVGRIKEFAGVAGIAFGGAAIVSGLKTVIAGTFEYATTVNDLRQKMDVSVETAQRWKYAADQNAASIEDVASANTKLQVQLDGGSKSTVDALKAAGLEFTTIRNMNPADAFNATVAAVAKIPDPMTQSRIALELFGKAGIELLPAIRGGFADAAAEAPFMSEATIKALADAKQAWDNLGTGVTIVTGQIIGNMMSLAQEATSSARSFFGFLEVAIKQGPGAAMQLAGAMREARTATTDTRSETEQLIATQKQMVHELLESGKSHQEVAKLMNLTTDQVKILARATGDLTPEQERAAAESDRLAKAFQAQVDVLTGKALKREIAELNKEVAAAEKQGGLMAYQYIELGKKLDDLKAKGAQLPPTLHSIWLEHERLNPSIKVTTDAYAGLVTQIKALTLQPPPPLNIPVNIGPVDLTKFGQQLGPLEDAPEAKGIGKQLGDAALKGLDEGMKGLGGVIVGAIQGGGDPAKAAGASLGASIGNEMSDEIENAVGGRLGKLFGSLSGPLGAIAGGFLGNLAGKGISWLGGILGFKSNDTKKMREEFASEMGMTLSQLYDDLRKKFGAQGESLAAAALNTIGRKDIAAQQAWFKEVEALYAKYKKDSDAAASATEDAAEREAEAHKKVTDAIQSKIDTVQSEYDQVFKGIEDELNNPEYDEAGNRIYGVEEARGLARLEQLQKEKDALQQQMEAAKALQDDALSTSAKKITDTAGVIRTGIEEIFKDPIRVLFDIPRVTLPGGGSFGGGYVGGGTGTSAYVSRASQPVVVQGTFVTKLNNRVLARENIQVLGEMLGQTAGW